tara:strand:+ start:10395 stop:12008 length:1614 start_codon:yes stop_codon:yes gene_type:complete
MPHYKFSEDDVFFNRIKTHPSCHFFSWKGCTYYNNQYIISGALNSPVGHVGYGVSSITSSCKSGYINVYELNIDRAEAAHTLHAGNGKNQNPNNWSYTSPSYSVSAIHDRSLSKGTSLIFPFTTKDGSRNSLRSVTSDSYVDDYTKGDVITGSYPLTASITRVFFEEGSPENGNQPDPSPHEPGTTFYYQNKEQTTMKRPNPADPGKEKTFSDVPKLKKTYIQALKNTIEHYKKWSPHFIYSSSFDPLTGISAPGRTWDKSYQAVNIIDIPSIVYGSSIKKGTISLKYYITGTLVGELNDLKRNGELIQTGPSGSFKSGSVAGIVLYNEGAIVLTGSWDLTTGHDTTFSSPEGDSRGEFGPAKKQDYRYYTSDDSPSWVYFGTGMNDGYPTNWISHAGAYSQDEGTSHVSLDSDAFHSSSFELEFSGTNYIPTITMMAHAKKGYLNWSNNPTYLKHNQASGSVSGSSFYRENNIKNIKNTISSSYDCGFTGSFKKQTFIDKIGIYDKNKNLIAIAKVATPVRKLETDEYTFKLKLDI